MLVLGKVFFLWDEIRFSGRSSWHDAGRLNLDAVRGDGHEYDEWRWHKNHG